MNDTFEKIKAFVKSNPLILIAVAAAAVLLFFPKLLKGRVRHRRRRVARSYVHRVRRRVTRRRVTTRGRKKPWQVKGSLAARRHMARIRARR